MNPKVKKLLDAKNAWLAAHQAKKPIEEVKTLYKAVQDAQAEVDEALATGELKPEDLQVKEDAGAADEGKLLDLEDLKGALATIVADQLKALVPAGSQDKLTPDAIKAAVADAMKAYDAGKLPNLEDFRAAAGKAVQTSLDRLRTASKFAFNLEDNSQISIPYGNSKGNLPLHKKQLLNVMMKRPADHGIDVAVLERGKTLGEQMLCKYEAMARRGEKALTSTGAGTGDEFVPTDLASELQRRFYLSSDLAALMAAREIDMPSQPYEYPLSTTRPTFYLETTENTAATATDPGTAKIVLDAKKLMGRVDFSYEVDEDSIVPVLGWVQEQLAAAGADAYEDGLINGDTTGTHQDSDYQAVAKHAARAFHGFRKMALAGSMTTSLATGGINEENLRAMKKMLGKYGVRVRDLAWIVGAKGVNDVGAIANVSTLEKYGPRATILTGEIAAFLGVPVIVSERMRENLNASGVYDGTTTTKGSIVLAYLPHFLAGRRREFTVEADRDIKTQTQFLVASYRRAFVPHEAVSTTISACVLGYNYNS